MFSPKIASRVGGITVAVGLGVAVTSGHGVASADSTPDGDAAGAPPAPTSPDTTQPQTTPEPAKAPRTALQRRETTGTALRDRSSLLRWRDREDKPVTDEGNVIVRARQNESTPDRTKSEAATPHSMQRRNAVITPRPAVQKTDLQQNRAESTDLRIRTTAPEASSPVVQHVPSPRRVPSMRAPSPAPSPIVARIVDEAVAPTTPAQATRATRALTTLIAGAGLHPNAVTPTAPTAPALPRMLELAYAAWRRVVVSRFFNSTPTTTVAVDYDHRDPVSGTVSGTVTGADADGDRLTYTVQQAPATGTLDFHDDGSFTYTPDQDLAHQPNPEDVTFTVRVSDEASGPHLHLLSRTQHATVATVRIEIEQLNRAPAITVSDPNPQSDGSIRFTVTPTDPDTTDRDSLKVTWSDPANGTVAPVDGLTNVYAYTPEEGYPHTLSAPTADPFTFTVTDRYGETGTAAASPVVQPVNEAPVLTVGTPARQSDGSYSIALSATDADLDTVRVTPPSLDPSVGSWEGLDPDGTVVLTAANPTRTITFVPQQVTRQTTLTFQFAADDGRYLGTDTGSTSLTLRPNRPPNFVVANVSAPDPTTGAVTITYTKSDPDGDPVTLTANGIDPNARFVDNGDGTATYSPDRDIVRQLYPNGTASDAFTIVASDGRGGSASEAVDATMIFTNQKPYPLFEDPVVVDVATGEIRGKVTILDPDGDAARFILASTDPSFPETATPGTLMFDKDTGEYTFVPKDSVRTTKPGQRLTLIVTVEDSYGGRTNTGASVLYVVPKPEVILPPDQPPSPGDVVV